MRQTLRYPAALALTTLCGLAAAETPTVAPFQVNTTTAGSQYGPAIAVNAAGNFVVSWHMADGDGNGMFAQRFDAQAQKVGGEFQINQATANGQIQGSVGMADDGRMRFAWLSEQSSTFTPQAFVRRYDSSGNPTSNETQVSLQNNTYGYFHYGPQIAATPDGSYLAGYHKHWNADPGKSGRQYDVIYRTFTASGSFFGSGGGEGIANETTSVSQQNIHFAVNRADLSTGASDEFISVWQSAAGEDGDGLGILARLLPFGGTPTANEVVINQTTTGTQQSPDVAMAADGSSVVVWQSDSADDTDGDGWGVFGRRVDAAGMPVGDEFLLSQTTAGDQTSAGIAMDLDGNFLAVWNSAGQDGDGSGVYARRFASDGTPLGDEFQVSDNTAGDQFRGGVAWSKTGAYFVTWRDDNGVDGDGSGVFAAIYADLDYGDAPDPGYPSLLSSDGARHAVGALRLGANADSENNARPDANATGDDVDVADDEDGITIPTLGTGVSGEITVTVSDGPGLLDAWIDFNADGDWDDAGEQIFDDEPVVTGANTLEVLVPADAATGSTFGRFRLSTAGVAAVTGEAADGEVEDHEITVQFEAPAGLSFKTANVTGQQAVYSGIVRITGLSGAALVDIDGHPSARFSINGGALQSGAAMIRDGDLLRLRAVSSPTFGDVRRVYVSVAGATAEWRVQTVAPPDTEPDPFDFVDVAVAAQQAVFSNIERVSGINRPVDLMLSGHPSARVSVNGGALQAGPVVVNGGDTIRLRMVSAPDASSRSATVSIGGISDVWTVSKKP
ncbi:MAG: GEVED domain-containing protein [Sinimarinibacterium flocculans]|uniref:GEVED domain-containing protein n=1 Tax=Sinimarinibacterium flocculans TaxID=985250 RepID=UPI003C4F8D0A